MKTRVVTIGGVIMAFLIIHNANGQTQSSRSGNSSDPKMARQLIEATLQWAVHEEDAAEQVARYRTASDHVFKLCPTNLEVAGTLNEGRLKAAKAKDDRQAAKLMRDALREVQATLSFEPYIEAPLPEGFPEPTPVGEIRIKKYPDYRLARTQMAGVESRAFWILFTHIKKKDIAMTAPVEMTYKAGKDTLQPQSMAFLYRSVKQGQTGKDEKVEVIDVPATMALSFGMRGDVTKARLAETRGHLEAWLRNNASEYEASGPLRVMGYNSPFVAASRRFTELEIPVRRTTPNR